MKCRLILVAVLLFAFHSSIVAQDKEAKKDERKTHTVKAGFFEVVEEVTATVESRNMVEIVAETDQWSDLEISKVVPEGTTVNADDEVIWFKTEDIDRKIKDSKYALELAELTLQATGLDLDLTQNTFALDMELGARKQQHLEEDYKYFTEIDRPNRERSTRRNVQNSQHALEYAQEEYNQLKRMYDEDELTEESEEIVLTRTQRDVENRQFYLEQAQMRAARTLETEIPREAEQKKADLDRAKLEFEKSRIEMPLNRDKKKIAFEKARIAFDNEKADFDALQKDRERMTIKSPGEGILYYGRCVRGKWMGPAGPNRDLSEGKKAVANKVIATIVDPDALMLRADLSEKQLASIRVGSDGLATPTAFPDSHAQATVEKIGYVPVQANTFDCQMSLSDTPDSLLPGMTCKVRFVIERQDAALTVPEAAVFTDDGVSHYVFVVDGDGHRRQNVTTGLTSGGNIHIAEGLQAGDEILTERPE